MCWQSLASRQPWSLTFKRYLETPLTIFPAWKVSAAKVLASSQTEESMAVEMGLNFMASLS
jgi:hypothetical protein